MYSFDVRLFHDDASIVTIGEGFLAAILPRAAWTHGAHLAACCWLVRDRADIDIERELPAIISAYNVASGGVNDDVGGTMADTPLSGVIVPVTVSTREWQKNHSSRNFPEDQIADALPCNEHRNRHR